MNDQPNWNDHAIEIEFGFLAFLIGVPLAYQIFSGVLRLVGL